MVRYRDLEGHVTVCPMAAMNVATAAENKAASDGRACPHAAVQFPIHA